MPIESRAQAIREHKRMLKAASIIAKHPVRDSKEALAMYMATVITICRDNCASLADAELIINKMLETVRQEWADTRGKM